jgi:hypothetical protein
MRLASLNRGQNISAGPFAAAANLLRCILVVFLKLRNSTEVTSENLVSRSAATR